MLVSKDLGKINPIVLADYILQNYGPMSHLKVQKLLYYCDAYHLAKFDQELVATDFEAWVHGPVSRPLFNELRDKSLIYSDLSYEGDKNTHELLSEKLTTSQISLINTILGDLCTWNDFELEHATHIETPWKEARGMLDPGARCTNIISKITMKQFYTNEIQKGEASYW